MRGGAINLTVLQGLSPNTPYVCGSTRIDQATALGKTEAYNSIYDAVRRADAGGRQAAIADVVQAARDAVVAAAAAAAGGGAALATAEQNYISTHSNYVGLYKSGGNFYTVAINKAPGTVAENPPAAAAPAPAAPAPAAAPPQQRPAIPAAAGGGPGLLLTAAAAAAAAAVRADYIIVEA